MEIDACFYWLSTSTLRRAVAYCHCGYASQFKRLARGRGEQEVEEEEEDGLPSTGAARYQFDGWYPITGLLIKDVIRFGLVDAFGHADT